MPLSGEALNAQGDAICRQVKPAIGPNWATIATDTSQSPEASSANKKKIVKAAHGLNTGDIIVFTNINGKTVLGEEAGGLFVGVPYWVRKVSTSEFCVANTKAQAEASEAECVEYTVEVKAESVIKKIEEHTGAKTKRREVKYKAAANLLNESEGTAPEVEASASVKVRWVIYWSAEEAGTFCGIEAVTEKELASGDLFKVTSTKIFQNAYIK